jgi:integrase
MAKTTHNLTDLQLRRWVAAKQPLAKSDGDGLTFTLSSAGTAAWVLRYRNQAGRRRELTLGNYPDIGLSAARELARAKRAAIDSGADPAAQKQEERSRSAAAMTVAELVADYRAKVLHSGQLAPGTVKYREADFEAVILPRFRSWEVRRVTSLDVVQALRDAKRTWAITKRVLTSMSKLMEHACGSMVIPANPCTGIKLSAIMGPKPAPRRRVMLDTAELRAILPTIDETIGRLNGLAFRILLATCVRGVELFKTRQEHVDLDAGSWWVPDEDVKTRSGFLVPLSPPVVDWFRELVAMAGDSAYLLPARREDRGDTHLGRTTLWAALKRAFDRGDIDIRHFTPHDTRSTAKGHLRNLGFSREISEIALNHALKGMEGIYDVREEIPERRRALAAWTEFLVACETGQAPTPGNVVPLRRVA